MPDYLPLTGGTITGDLTINGLTRLKGKIDVSADATILHALVRAVQELASEVRS